MNDPVTIGFVVTVCGSIIGALVYVIWRMHRHEVLNMQQTITANTEAVTGVHKRLDTHEEADRQRQETMLQLMGDLKASVGRIEGRLEPKHRA